jgi:hypothetical protein
LTPGMADECSQYTVPLHKIIAATTVVMYGHRVVSTRYNHPSMAHAQHLTWRACPLPKRLSLGSPFVDRLDICGTRGVCTDTAITAGVVCIGNAYREKARGLRGDLLHRRGLNSQPREQRLMCFKLVHCNHPEVHRTGNNTSHKPLPKPWLQC